MIDLQREGALIGQLRGARWLLLAVGLFSLVAGIIVLAKPSISLATMAVVAGVFLFLDGIGELIVGLFGSSDRRVLTVTVAVASAVVGVLLVRHPCTAWWPSRCCSGCG